MTQAARSDASGLGQRLATVWVANPWREGRRGEPVRQGVPLARGLVQKAQCFRLVDASGASVPLYAEPLGWWPDGSLRWLHLSFAATVPKQSEERYGLYATDTAAWPKGGEWQRCGDAWLLERDRLEWAVRATDERLTLNASEALTGGGVTIDLLSCLDEAGGRCRVVLDQAESESQGSHEAALRLEGRVLVGRRTLEFTERLRSFAEGLIEVELTVRNPRRAVHRGGLWDLGDTGSVLFRSLAVRARPHDVADGVEWSLGPEMSLQSCDGSFVEVYQDSSGGAHWDSSNHVSLDGKPTPRFCGYESRTSDGVETGKRASPVMGLVTNGWRLSAAIEGFWEQFPKGIAARDGELVLELFPQRCSHAFELQGGEQKTHRLVFRLEVPGAGDERSASLPLSFVHARLRPRVAPEDHLASGAWPAFVPSPASPHREYEEYIESVVEGEHSFVAKRETADEYGWRHFGDVYADHENAYYQGESAVVSHYNNQYDLVYGLLVQHARSGDTRWYELARDLARHVVDIDIYHTQEDKAAYSGGLFWHTNHYVDAGRSTHRTYSADSAPADLKGYGGGPCNEHNYTTGLLYYFWLSGDPRAREGVVGLADWVIHMDDGRRNVLGAVDAGPTGLASGTHSPLYHGPGRGAGNSINALLDAYVLTHERRFLEKAEALIRRCVHPEQAPEELQLGDLEARWSYLVFLQVLGKYLDLKCEWGEQDVEYEYARRVLIRFADWMLLHEVPYRHVLDRVEYPTETWPAHDVRKSVIFGYAARYGTSSRRQEYLARADEFFRECFVGLTAFDRRFSTRPRAILLSAGWHYSGLLGEASVPAAALPPTALDFGAPVDFVPQKERVKRRLKSPRGWFQLSTALLRPSALALLWRTLVSRVRS